MGKKTRFGYKPLAEKYYQEMQESLPSNFKLDFGHMLFLSSGTSEISLNSKSIVKEISVISKFKDKKEVQWNIIFQSPIDECDIYVLNEVAIGTFQISPKDFEIVTANNANCNLLIKPKPLDRFTAYDGLQKIIPIEVVGLSESPLNQITVIH